MTRAPQSKACVECGYPEDLVFIGGEVLCARCCVCEHYEKIRSLGIRGGYICPDCAASLFLIETVYGPIVVAWESFLDYCEQLGVPSYELFRRGSFALQEELMLRLTKRDYDETKYDAATPLPHRLLAGRIKKGRWSWLNR